MYTSVTSSKEKFYKTIFRLILLHDSETWTLTEQKIVIVGEPGKKEVR